MYCPECGAEYRPRIERCADCGAELMREFAGKGQAGPDGAYEPAEAAPSPAARPVTVVLAVWIAALGLAAASVVWIVVDSGGRTLADDGRMHWGTAAGHLLGLLLAVGISARLLAALARRRRWACVPVLLLPASCAWHGRSPAVSSKGDVAASSG